MSKKSPNGSRNWAIYSSLDELQELSRRLRQSEESRRQLELNLEDVPILSKPKEMAGEFKSSNPTASHVTLVENYQINKKPPEWAEGGKLMVYKNPHNGSEEEVWIDPNVKEGGVYIKEYDAEGNYVSVYAPARYALNVGWLRTAWLHEPEPEENEFGVVSP